MITGSIDVTKIVKERLYTGQKGTYLDFVLIETPNSEYGDYMVVQSISKEERERGVKGQIIGNAKILAKKNQQSVSETPGIEGEPDNLPF